jgi:hypothetical protein
METVPFFESQLNITSKVMALTPFFCECGWEGIALDLSLVKSFSCCPKCLNLDVRIHLTFLKD